MSCLQSVFSKGLCYNLPSICGFSSAADKVRWAADLPFKTVGICPICRAEMAGGKDIVVLHPGSMGGDAAYHAFHLACIREWFEWKKSCPTCQAPIENVCVKFLRAL
jgi:hypothetical protein